MNETLGLGLTLTSAVFAVLLAAVSGVWYARERTLSIHAIVTPAREAFHAAPGRVDRRGPRRLAGGCRAGAELASRARAEARPPWRPLARGRRGRGRSTAVGEVPALPGDEVLRVDGDVVTAGLVNTHHHLYPWATRGRAVDSDLFGWLAELDPVWARLDPEDVGAAALVGLAELALSDCTTVADHHYVVPRGDDSVFDRIADASRAVGVRLHLARRSMDLGASQGGLPPGEVVEDSDAILISTEDVVARRHDGVRITVTVAPCSPFSVTPELMTESAALARRLGLRLHTHLAETVEEERDALRLATEGGAACLGRDDVGQLEPGLRADLAGWRGDDPAEMPDPLAALVLGSDRQVRHLLVEGEPVVTDGRLVGVDLRAARADLARRAQRLWTWAEPDPWTPQS